MTDRRSEATVEVFAVEPAATQLVVRAREGDSARLAVGADVHVVELHEGIGAVVVEGLQPATSYPLRLGQRPAGVLTTLAAPPGAERGRFATVSDIHVGETGFGHLPRFHSAPDPAHAHPAFCLRAALREIEAWGAEGLVVKGDIAHDCRQREYDIAGELLGSYRRPLHAMAGNHDGGNHLHDDAAAALAPYGITVHRATAQAFRVGGMSVLSADTVRAGHEHGYAPAADDELFAHLRAADAAVVILHHQLMTTRIPYYVPFGIPKRPARDLLDRIAAANPAALVTTGHTHRHRRRDHGPVVITEVGSVKDHPGTWAGYVVYDGGIVQTVRRIMEPAALAWTERTRRSALGAWGRWSPGRLADRSFTHPWPSRQTGSSSSSGSKR